MTATSTHSIPLVSVIITCYNHGNYLADSIQSVLNQTYPRPVELVVIDDGSTDNSKDVATSFPQVIYHHQINQGLSAARNRGINNSTGDFLMFLDADDWFLPDAISTNVGYLQQNEQLAFVSGGHDKVYVGEGITKVDVTEIKDHHFLHLLQGNYIGMHGTVMYRRRIFDEFLYDTTLKSCEDYDLYLKISRKYPVFHHSKRIAAYRLHTANMSWNIPVMLATTLQVLQRQQPELETTAEVSAFWKGQSIWQDYYCKELYEKLRLRKAKPSIETLAIIVKYKPALGIRYLISYPTSMLKKMIKRTIPGSLSRRLHKNRFYKTYRPTVGSVENGDFDRTTPFSTEFGYDRGGPIDRYYIENFLQKEAGLIRGRVLEIGDNSYTMQYGGKNVTQSEILHVNDTNPMATIIGDISSAPQIPDNSFDCIVLTQTLHLIYDFKEAVQTCHRILKPGGTLLLTVPGITPIDHDEWKETWYWAFTDKSMKRLVAETFVNGQIDVHDFGNVYVASAFLYGMGLPEVPKEKLDYYDPQFQVIITVKARK